MLCRTCYHEIPRGSVTCPHCGAPQAAAAPPPAAGAPASGPAKELSPAEQPAREPGPGNPWEARGPGDSPVAAFGATLQESLFRPAAFFRATAPSGGTGRALLYAALVGTISFAVFALWQRAMDARFGAMFGDHWREVPRPLPAWRSLGIFVPFGVLAWVISASAIFHVSLKVVGAAKSGFAATLKAVCYAASGLAVLALPLCGAPVAAVWTAVLQVVGFRELHRTTSGRAFFAWVLPALVTWFLVFSTFVILGLGFLKLWQGLGGRFDV